MGIDGKRTPDQTYSGKHSFRFVTAVVLATMVTGCGVLHLRDEVKATASKESVDQYTEIDLQEGITKRAANFNKLEVAYLEAVAKRAKTQRNVSLARTANHEGSFRDLVFSDVFQVDRVLSELDITSRKRIQEFKKALAAYATSSVEYGSKRDTFKKTFKTATKKLGVELDCLRSSEATVDSCRAVVDGNDGAAGDDAKQDREPDPRLPAPLETLAPVVTACLSEEVPVAETPSYMQYSFTVSRPAGISDDEYKEILPKLERMEELFAAFNAGVDQAYGHHAKHCREKVIPARDAIAGFGGTGKKLIESLTTEMDKAAAYQKESAQRRSALAEAVAAYNERASVLGVLKKKDDEDKLEDPLKKNLETIRDVIKGLDDFTDIAGIEIAADEQLKAIDGFIEALVEGEVAEGKLEDRQKLKRFASVASSVASLRKQFGELAEKEAEIKLSVLLTQRKISEAKRKWAETRAAIQLQRIALINNHLMSLGDDSGGRSVITLYDEAFTRLNRYLGLNDNFDPIADKSFNSNWDKMKVSTFVASLKPGQSTNEKAAEEIAHALANLVTARQIALGVPEATKVQADMLDGKTALARSEMSLLMWDSIIRGPLSLVAAYHETGIKPEEVAKLVVLASGFVGVGLAE